MLDSDNRVWIETDRPGERVTLARPVPTTELMSVTGSTRLWTEVHTQVCMALVTPGQPGVEAKWRTRARTLSTRASGLMLIEPGDVHVTQAVSKSSNFEVVRFVPEVLEQAVRELGVSGNFHFRSPASENADVGAGILALIHAHARGAETFELESRSAELIATVIAEIAETPTMPRTAIDPVRDFRLRRARDYLRSHLEQKPSLDMLALELKVSKYRLCTIFKQAYGVSVGQYWMAARIAEASRRLLSGMPIKLVAGSLGFADEPFFTRIFRRHRGMPPGAWVRLQEVNSAKSRGSPLMPRLARPA
jgi:AraC-like DNA-binding protein